MLKMSRNGVKSMLKVSIGKMFDKRYSLFGVSIIFCKVFFFFMKAVHFGEIERIISKQRVFE